MQMMTIFFDGACPLCAAEIHMLAARNTRRLLKFVDLGGPGTELPCNIVCARAMDNIHAVLEDGSTLVGVPVFAEAYRRADLPALAWLLSRLWLRWLLDPAYALFARHREKISALLGPPLLRFAQYAWRQPIHSREGENVKTMALNSGTAVGHKPAVAGKFESCGMWRRS